MNIKTLKKHQRLIETGFHGYDAAFPVLKGRADRAGNDADRDALFRVHQLLRAALRDLEGEIARKEGTA